MDIWSVPTPAVITALILVYLMRLASTRISNLTYDFAEDLSERKEISSSNIGLVRRQLTPSWVNPVGWTGTLGNLALFVYLGLRFGWLWAIGYAVLSHLLESYPPPFPPTSGQARAMVLTQARKNAPHLVKKLEDR